MVAASLLLVALALVLFGWADLHYYATQILPRTLEGGSIDPYNPGTPTLSTLLRRSFMQEPELNPTPLVHAPWVFFFLRTLLSLAILSFTLAGLALSRQSGSDRQHFAWFTIAVLLLSTNTAPYTFIVLLLPLILLLEDAGPRLGTILVALYVLITLPLHPQWLFPKV